MKRALSRRKRLGWWFVRSAVGQFIHLRLLTRSGYHGHCPICRWVWRELESDPAFVAGMRRAEAELAAGKGVRYRVVGKRLVPVDDEEPGGGFGWG